jgi:hypothetical protein
MRSSTIIVKKKEGEETEHLVDKDRTFFCSELVAKAYKVCGIMVPTDEASSNFLPVDFSSAS